MKSRMQSNPAVINRVSLWRRYLASLQDIFCVIWQCWRRRNSAWHIIKVYEKAEICLENPLRIARVSAQILFRKISLRVYWKAIQDSIDASDKKFPIRDLWYKKLESSFIFSFQKWVPNDTNVCIKKIFLSHLLQRREAGLRRSICVPFTDSC